MPNNLQAQLLALIAALKEKAAAAHRSGDRELERKALSELKDAHTALGTGNTTGVSLENRIECTIFSLLRHRAADSSICPSEVARVVESRDQWRTIMPATRTVAVGLAAAGVLAISRGGQTLDPNDLGKGHIRLRRGKLF